MDLVDFTNCKSDNEYFAGDKMMLRIVKELDTMQKNYDELIYYDPKKFHEAEMFEYGVEQNKLSNAKECIKKILLK